MAGTGSVDLWVTSTSGDADLQVTLSEVRPDGTERYVQNGWLRLSHRKLDRERSTALAPVPHRPRGRRRGRCPSGRFVQARVQIFPFAYSFRAGSQIRLTVQAPGGDRPLWTFDTPTGDHGRDGPDRPRPRPPVAGGPAGAAREPGPSRRPGAVPVAAGRAVPDLRRAPAAAAGADRVLDSALVSKANKRERQRQNRELAKIERERLIKRDQRMRTVRGLLFVLVPVIILFVIFSLIRSDDDKQRRRHASRTAARR